MSDRATLSAAESAIVDYTLYVTGLDDDARELLTASNEAAALGYPETAAAEARDAARFRDFARIAYRAGRAERIDPEPAAVRSCGICSGVRRCDFDAHRSRS